jgi:hypothetical protein
MTAKDVAQWMLEELQRSGVLSQRFVLHEIPARFGEEFICSNKNGNPAIVRQVLREFRWLTKNTVVWVARDNCWRFRTERDTCNRRTVKR